MSDFKSRVLMVGLLILVPIIGILAGTFVAHDFENKYEKTIIGYFKEKEGLDLQNDKYFLNKIKLSSVCSKKKIDPFYHDICKKYHEMNQLTFFSVITLGFITIIFLIYYILGRASSKNRQLLFYTFRPGLFISQICAALLVTCNAGILIFSIYIAETHYLKFLHAGLIVGLALMATIATISILINALVPIKCTEATVYGKILNKLDFPIIWKHIELLAKKVGTKTPDTIIAGMEPNFFVTEASVVCLDGKITGRSLFISLPACRIITISEFTAIICHELGHFIGNDTKWSKKFFPIYKGSLDTLSLLNFSENEHGFLQLAKIPSLIFINFFILAFEKAEKTISRSRELAADTIGAEITSIPTMGSALLKAHIFQYVWYFTQSEMKDALTAGKQITNLSILFFRIYESLPEDFMKSEICKINTTHPTDNHPPLSERLNTLGVTLDDIYARGLIDESHKKAIELIEETATLEEELSEIEHIKIIKSGKVNPPDNNNKSDVSN